jgi:hypothetical protein
MAPVLHLDPAIKPASTVSVSRCFETSPSSPIRQACRNKSGPISPCSNGARPACRRRRTRPRHRADANAAVEVRPAIDAKQHRLAVNTKEEFRLRSAASLAPIVPVAGEQPHALAFTLNDQAVTVVLNFVDPLGPVWNLGAFGGNAGFERSTHAVYLGDFGGDATPEHSLGKGGPGAWGLTPGP